MAPGDEIDAVELLNVRQSADGRGLRLRVRDRTGRQSVVTLPMQWLNTMLGVVPQPPLGSEVQPVESWTIDRTAKDLLLTLRTPDGQALTFAVKPWQVEGMATIATYGRAGDPGVTTH